jgi:hypothetical protein
VQLPVQLAAEAVAEHTYWHGLPVFCQVPVLSHVCGCRLLHWWLPGVQLPLQVPELLLQTYWQALPLFCHAPVLSQTCGCWLLHWWLVGVQVPVHLAVLLSQTYWQATP